MSLDIRAAPGHASRAEALRDALQVRGYRHSGTAALALELSDAGLDLLREDVQPALRLHLDFSRGRQGYRLAHAGYQREDVIRAMGKLPRHSRVIDASAGLGRDTLLLAAHGFRVEAWERHPVVYRLLSDALERAACEPTLARVIDRITLHEGTVAPGTLDTRADAAIFDPMFPGRVKSAAVKKDMQLLQALIPTAADSDAEQTLTTLRATVERRIVVKRPQHASALGPDIPQSSVPGKSVRFDIYPVTHPAP
jgi:16S rRNA (guanine1516-N2)-methyltransferase